MHKRALEQAMAMRANVPRQPATCCVVQAAHAGASVLTERLAVFPMGLVPRHSCRAKPAATASAIEPVTRF